MREGERIKKCIYEKKIIFTFKMRQGLQSKSTKFTRMLMLLPRLTFTDFTNIAHSVRYFFYFLKRFGQVWMKFCLVFRTSEWLPMRTLQQSCTEILEQSTEVRNRVHCKKRQPFSQSDGDGKMAFFYRNRVFVYTGQPCYKGWRNLFLGCLKV